MSATKKRTLPSTGQGTDHDQADGNKRPFSKEEKGKGRVGNRSSADSRKLALSDVWEMATGVPKRLSAFSSHNVLVAVLPSPTSSFPQTSSNGRLIAYPLPPYSIPSLKSRSTPPPSSASSFALPLPPFPIPHSSPTHLSLSPSSSFLLAFFPLSIGPGGLPRQGGSLVLWSIAGAGRKKADWLVRDRWALGRGEEVVDIVWLGPERAWSTTVERAGTNGDDGRTPKNDSSSSNSPTYPPALTRLPPLGPPLPSQPPSSPSFAYSYAPTFLVLSSNHEAHLYHPTSPLDKGWPLRVLKCGLVGPGVGVWGLINEGGATGVGMGGFSGVGPDGGLGGNGEGGEERRMIRKGKIMQRAEDHAIYIAIHSTTPPVCQTFSPSIDPNRARDPLASLATDLDPHPSATTSSPPSMLLSEPSGHEAWIEIVECKVDLLGAEASITTRPLPPIHLISTLDSSPLVTPTSILTHLALVDPPFAPPPPSQEVPSPDLPPDRPLSLVAFFLDVGQDDDSLSSSVHSWSITRESLSLSEAFSHLDEAATMDTDPIDPDLSLSLNTDLIEWIATYSDSVNLPSLVLTSLEPVGCSSKPLALVGRARKDRVESGLIGDLAVLDLSSLAFDETWSTTPLPSLLPITTSISPNSSIIALLGSYPSDPAISFVPHPMLNYPTTTPAPGESIPSPIADEALSPTSPTSERARHLAVLFALAIHSGTDLSDIIRLTLEGSSLAKKQDDLLAFITFVLQETWAVFCHQEQKALEDSSSTISSTSGSPSAAARSNGDGPLTLADSQWLLPIIALQVALYRSAGDARWQLGSEVLQLAAADAAFSQHRRRGSTRGSEASVGGVQDEEGFDPDSVWTLIDLTSTTLSTISSIFRSALLTKAWDDWSACLSTSTETPSPQNPFLHTLHLIHPTFRSLLISLLSQIASLNTFLQSYSHPLPLPPPFPPPSSSSHSTTIPSSLPAPPLIPTSPDLVELLGAAEAEAEQQAGGDGVGGEDRKSGLMATNVAREMMQDLVGRSGMGLGELESFLAEEIKDDEEGGSREEVDLEGKSSGSSSMLEMSLLSLSLPPSSQTKAAQISSAVYDLHTSTLGQATVLHA